MARNKKYVKSSRDFINVKVTCSPHSALHHNVASCSSLVTEDQMVACCWCCWTNKINYGTSNKKVWRVDKNKEFFQQGNAPFSHVAPSFPARSLVNLNNVDSDHHLANRYYNDHEIFCEPKHTTLETHHPSTLWFMDPINRKNVRCINAKINANHTDRLSDSGEICLELMKLQHKRLQMEEVLLLQRKYKEELERTRGPIPKWYEIKTRDFSTEIQKFNNLLKNENSWSDLFDYRNKLFELFRDFKS